MDLVNSLDGRLLFAVPKKGRLMESTLELLKGADIQFRRHSRLDIALCTNHPIALVFLPAGDIPRFVGEGRVDLGITGQDQVAESRAPNIEEKLLLGFGKCKLQIQVPEKGDITDPRQLVGKNVVTSFTTLAAEYFGKLEGGKTAGELTTKIKYVGGSVEAACALGVADGIVDLVESGETMKAAGLKAIDTVMTTEAVLIKSGKPSDAHLVAKIIKRIEGVIAAQKYVLCTYNLERSKLEAIHAITPGQRNPTVTALDEEGWIAVSVMVQKKSDKGSIADIMDQLEDIGARDILITSLSNSRAGNRDSKDSGSSLPKTLGTRESSS